MLFSSYEFLFAFLPLTALGYFALSRVNNPYPQRVFLAAASLFFYSFFEWSYFFIIAASILVNFAFAKISLGTDSKRVKQLLLSLSSVFNVGLIGYYKYYDFAVGTINSVASTDFVLKGILIPLGISFFTFQQLSFQIRTYKTTDKSLNFIDYTLYWAKESEEELEILFSLREQVARFAEGHKNIRLLDFQAEEYTTDLDKYIDFNHFGEEIQTRMETDITETIHSNTCEQVKQNSQTIRTFALSAREQAAEYKAE